MKKIFLLSLLSVLFLSAFSQIIETPKILSKINITRISGDDEEGISQNRGWWIFFYKKVTTQYNPNGSITLICTGWGWKVCIANFNVMPNLMEWAQRGGFDNQIIENTLPSVFEESDSRAENGEYSGNISKKLALRNANNESVYLLFSMNWEYDRKNPRDGKAEIIISTTNHLGF
jgi:hypothetical protein